MRRAYHQVGRANGCDAFGESLPVRPFTRVHAYARQADLIGSANPAGEIPAAGVSPETRFLGHYANLGLYDIEPNLGPRTIAEDVASTGSEAAAADRHPIDAAVLQLQTQVGPPAEML